MRLSRAGGVQHPCVPYAGRLSFIRLGFEKLVYDCALGEARVEWSDGT
jgi:hypothetical protein